MTGKPLWADPQIPYLKKEHRDDIGTVALTRYSPRLQSVSSPAAVFSKWGRSGGRRIIPYLITENAIAAVSKAFRAGKSGFLGFASIDVSTEDTARVPEGYIAPPVLSLG